MSVLKVIQKIHEIYPEAVSYTHLDVYKRQTLMTGNAPGNDMRFYNERVEASRNFANKVWNASRSVSYTHLDVYKRQEDHRLKCIEF